jgi:phosphatidate cytidylyltransferase
MAFNPQVFKTRALTALVFVAVMLAGLLWNGWSFFLLFTVIHFGCWAEYRRIMARIVPEYGETGPLHHYPAMLAGWCLMILTSGGMLPIGDMLLSEGPLWAVFAGLMALTVAVPLFSGKGGQKNLAITLFGLAYISASWALLIHLRSGQIWMTGPSADNPYGHFQDTLASLVAYVVPLVTIASIWINDTMAYLVGSLIGKTPLSPISPKKTWEGTIGGILLSVLVVTIIGTYWLKGDPYHFAGISLIASVAGTFGDLFESKLKRLADVKDSGHFMPGHGGFLDRFDSLLVAVPFVWIFCILFVR